MVEAAAELAADLALLVGNTHVLTRPSSLLAYESDGLPGYQRRPSLAVFPGTKDELIAVVRRLAADGTSFVARGAGTGLSGGALADGVVLLGLQRLRRILSVDPIARTATVEPGVVNATLTKAVAPHGLRRGWRHARLPAAEAASVDGALKGLSWVAGIAKPFSAQAGPASFPFAALRVTTGCRS